MKPFITFVVPMYNKENEINRLIKSISSSPSYSDSIEILVIDDSSTDNSINVMTPLLNDQVRLIRLPENAGVYYARNIGLENAFGKWIVCLDADDYLAANGLSKIIDSFLQYENNYSVILFSYLTDKGEKSGLIKEGEYSSEEYINEHTKEGEFIFRKEKEALYCVKKELLETNNIRWLFTNLDYTFKNLIALAGKKILFLDNEAGIKDNSLLFSLTRKRRSPLYTLGIVNQRLEYRMIYIEEFVDYFKNYPGGCKEIRRFFYDFKYCSYRFIYLPKIFSFLYRMKCHMYLRFILVCFLPIRTVTFLKEKSSTGIS